MMKENKIRWNATPLKELQELFLKENISGKTYRMQREWNYV